MEKRTPYKNIWRELSREKSMIFLAGPRQSGKTTLSKLIAESFTNHLYWNWDIGDHREWFFENKNFFTHVVRKDTSTPLIIFDEIHKYKDWKNYLKGVIDQFHKEFKFLISGQRTPGHLSKRRRFTGRTLLSFSFIPIYDIRARRG